MPLLETKGVASAQGFGLTLSSGPVTYIEDVFSTYLYTGNGSTQTITNGIDLSTKGGLVWSKARSSAFNHFLCDTARGRGYYLITDSTVAQQGPSTAGRDLSTFNSNGFSLGVGQYTDINTNAVTYASWTFRKQPKFFDIVTWTGNGSNPRNISHNLGSTPGVVIAKNYSSADSWYVYHRSLGGSQFLVLNGTDSSTTFSTVWANTNPTSTQFTVGATLNSNGTQYVAYLFAHNAGGFGLTGSDNVISCGSCSVGDTINLGYEPQWILAKRTDTTGDWYIDDNMRGWPAAGANDNPLLANSSAAEPTGYAGFSNITSTGFTCNFNGSYIYIAIRRGPMKVPTSGTSVFAPVIYTGDNTSTKQLTSGFPIDLIIGGDRSSPPSNVFDRLRGVSSASPVSYTSSTADEQSSVYGILGMTYLQTGDGTVRYQNSTGVNYVDWFFRRAPSFCDVVCYTGTGSATTQTHNLGVAPELMIVKSRSSSVYDWRAYSATLGATQYLTPNTTQSGAASSTSWNDTAPTASVFTVGSSAVVNGSGGTYVAYLFATCAGVSKVGSYTGTGALQTVNCGFTGGARFVLIKRTDSTGDWYVYDSARGISSSSDPYLLLNSSAAEVTGTNYVDTDSTGFKVTAAAPAGLNANGGTYIFLAIA